jgi:hypothetical protein
VTPTSLRRFWFKFADHPDSPLGYGVTAWTEDDARAILQTHVFKDGFPAGTVTPDIDVSGLDAGHILPNIESPTWRGIWFPRGYAEPKSN